MSLIYFLSPLNVSQEFLFVIPVHPRKFYSSPYNLRILLSVSQIQDIFNHIASKYQTFPRFYNYILKNALRFFLSYINIFNKNS